MARAQSKQITSEPLLPQRRPPAWRLERGHLTPTALARLSNQLYRRLSLIRGHLITTHAHPNEREIHDLRVATRRTAEAVAILAIAGYLPASHARRCTKLLRGIRRAAGTVRDIDAWSEKMSAESTSSPEIRRAARQLAAKRRAAVGALSHKLHAAIGDLSLRAIIDHARALDLHLKPAPLCQAIENRLDENGRKFHRRARRAFAAPTPERIHRTRIAGKQLRYLLELMQEGRLIRTPAALSALKTFQKAAGALQDAHSAAHLPFAARIPTAPSASVRRAMSRLTRCALMALSKCLQQFADAPFISAPSIGRMMGAPAAPALHPSAVCDK